MKKKPVRFRQWRPRVDANSPSLSGSSPSSTLLEEKTSVKLFLGGSSVSLSLKGGDGKKEEAKTNRGLPFWCFFCPSLFSLWLLLTGRRKRAKATRAGGELQVVFRGRRGTADSSSGPTWIGSGSSPCWLLVASSWEYRHVKTQLKCRQVRWMIRRKWHAITGDLVLPTLAVVADASSSLSRRLCQLSTARCYKCIYQLHQTMLCFLPLPLPRYITAF